MQQVPLRTGSRESRSCGPAVGKASSGGLQLGYRLNYACLDIFEVLTKFPDFVVALLVVDGLEIRRERSTRLSGIVATVEAEVANALKACPTAEREEIRAWRGAYRAFGVKKTSYRCSVERLLRGLERDRGLPAVNNLVDCYNAVSVRHAMPIGADDLDKIGGSLAFRYARPSDSFIALGDPGASDDPPKTGEVVYADQEKLLCRRWNWYQDARSAIGPETRRAVLTMQSLGRSDEVRKAAQELSAWCGVHLDARTVWTVADRGSPRVSVDLPRS